jgi:hypothetical protein
MSKYDPLYRHLASIDQASVTMTFAELAGILGSDLPRSAADYRAWWANETPADTRHVQALAWTLAGWTATPDLAAGSVAFDRKSG